MALDGVQTTIQTGGGASVGGAVTAGGAFIGRDQIIQGASPEQFADMLTRLLGLMVEIPQARNLLLGARTMLENARLQLRRMAEYKEAHDLLQQLESSYLVVYSLIYDERGLLAPGQVPWRGLEHSCDDLSSSIQRLCNQMAEASFAADVADCRRELAQAAGDLPRAFEGRDLVLLDDSLYQVHRVIGAQTSHMNDCLIEAVKGLQLAELARRLAAMHGALVEARSKLGQEQTEQLAALTGDVEGLVQLAARLTELRDAHNRWQHADDELRLQQDTLPTGGRHFAPYWQRSVRKRLCDLCAVAPGEQERALAEQITAVDLALAEPDLPALADAVDRCRRTVSRRLNQIDHDLRTLCMLLKEAGGPLDMLLEKLV